jgi:hypothetical protein
MKSIKMCALIPLMLVSSCYQKTLLFESETVSVTRTDSGSQHLVNGKHVEERWCRNQNPVLKGHNSHSVGLAEQAIYLAQGKGKDADFLVDARVFIDTDGCAIAEGTQAKVR